MAQTAAEARRRTDMEQDGAAKARQAVELVEGKVENNPGDSNGHHRFGATTKAYPWSFDHENLPYYDVHSAIMMKILPQEWGWRVLDCEYDTKPNGQFAVTKYIIYKNPKS